MQQPSNHHTWDETEETTFSDLLNRFLPFWPFFVLLMMLGVAGAWIYLRYKLPVYQSTASVLIKDDKNSATNPLEAFDLFGSAKSVANEVEILQSKTLMREVVKNLHLYAPVSVEGRVLNQSAYTYSPIKIESKVPDSLQQASKVYFKYDEGTRSVRIENTSYPLDQLVTTPFGVLRFLPNPYYSPPDRGGDFYFSLMSVKNAANGTLGRIKITPSSNQSTVIDLSIMDEVPQRGEDILNELLNAYNRASILDKNVLADNTLKFVEDRLRYVVNELDSVESRLENYKALNKITDISAQGQIFLQSVAANDQKAGEINMQLAVLDQVQSYVAGKEGAGGIVPATLGIADPALTNLLQKLSDLELKYAQTIRIVPENNPAVVALADGINNLKPGILENIESQRSNLLAGRKNLAANTNRYSSMLRTIPEKERELLGISRQQSIKNNIYTFILQKREETALSFASAVADSRIIDQAESSGGPVSPDRRRVYLMALLTALGLGIGIIYLKEMFTRTVQQRSDIEKYTDIPLLGEVVYDRTKSAIVIAEGNRSFVSEQFRQLRTSLSYMGINETHKKILVTSSISGEGKSFIAVNLGISLALMGKKVALLELDLRKPKLSELLRVPLQAGMTDYLIGARQPGDLIRNTGIENLFLISSGPIPPNPSELISNGRLPGLLEYLEGAFDYIILDSAPVNPVTDAYILSPLCDVTLFVIRHDHTPKVFVQKLQQQHSMNSLLNPAIVYNGIRGKGINKYGYGYGYGYGYAEKEKSKRRGWRKIFKN